MKIKCELEGDNNAICRRVASREVKFPADYPKDGWIPACEECIDRRKESFTMVFREFSSEDLFQDLLKFAKDYYRSYAPCSDVNDETFRMVARAKSLIKRSKAK